jgi:hypothetical protein
VGLFGAMFALKHDLLTGVVGVIPETVNVALALLF